MATKRKRFQRSEAQKFCERASIAQIKSQQWFEKYLDAGEITPELEEERIRIMENMFGCHYQRSR